MNSGTGSPPSKRPRPPGSPASPTLENVNAPSTDNGVHAEQLKRQKHPFSTRPLQSLPGNRIRTNDEIHGTIYLEPLIKACLDTPQMQRLRGLHQLGTTWLVYNNCTHTRFEHSLGVAHLSEGLVSELQRKQPNLDITDKDVLCVKLAGLCHDLGHGPFSHMYEMFRKMLKADKRKETERQEEPQSTSLFEKVTKGDGEEKKDGEGGSGGDDDEDDDDDDHEVWGLKMFDEMLRHLGLAIDLNKLDEPLRQVGDGISADCFGVTVGPESQTDEETKLKTRIFTSRDLVFVKECIVGGPIPGQDTFIGRPSAKEFLYDVVHNAESGNDTDRHDYLARDQYRAGVGPGHVDRILLDEAFVARSECPKGGSDECIRCRSHRVESAECVGAGRALPAGTHLTLAHPFKVVQNFADFFRGRFIMHSKVYTHKTAKAVEFMIVDLFSLAEDHFFLTANDGTEYSIANAVRDPSAYLQLKDSVLDVIQHQGPFRHCTHDEKDNLKLARDLVRRINTRDYYKNVVNQRLSKEKHSDIWDFEAERIKDDMLELWEEPSTLEVIEENGSGHGDVDEEGFVDISGEGRPIGRKDFHVEMRKIHYGDKEGNPVASLRFVQKADLHDNCTGKECINADNPENLPLARPADQDTYESHLPRTFLEKSIRIFSCASRHDPDAEAKEDAIKNCFDRWWKQNVRESGEGGGSMYEPSLSQL